MKKTRTYQLKRRAESREETRRRIVEAAMQLHEEVGPGATTISAIAARAGVQRLTVYRHFPDETAVFQACSSHWLSLNPPPDPQDWADIRDGQERARTALAAFHDYYLRTERMWTGAFRDVARVPALQGPMEEMARFLRGIGEDLIGQLAAEDAPAATGTAGQQGERPDTGRRSALAATVHHVLAFPTWLSLRSQGLDNAAMLELACQWIGATLSAAPDSHPRQNQ